MLLEKYGNKWCVKDCNVIFCNFAGAARKYNPEGTRNFNIKITDPAIAQELINDNFNVRLLNKLDEDDPDTWVLKIGLGWKINPKTGVKSGPEIKEVFENRFAELDDTNVHCLDTATIKKATVEFHIWEYEPGKFTARLDRAKFWVIDDWYSDEENIPF